MRLEIDHIRHVKIEKDGSQLSGFIDLRQHRADLIRIFVPPSEEKRRHGLGTGMLNQFTAKSRQAGVREIHVDIHPDREEDRGAMERFFSKHGFEQAGSGSNAFCKKL